MYFELGMDDSGSSAEGGGGGAGGLAALKALRTLRALRPLRAISRWQGMKVIFLISCDFDFFGKSMGMKQLDLPFYI